MRGELVQLAMAGDHDAFSELARGVIGRLYAIAILILRDQQRAEDATQEALVAAWRDLPALRDPDRFDAWLRRLLIRACHREAREQIAAELAANGATCALPLNLAWKNLRSELRPAGGR